MTSTSLRRLLGQPPRLIVLTATLGLAAACWGVAVLQMRGMNMGVATPLGSFPSFMQIALGIMSVTWMAVIAVLIIAQKLLPARAVVDVPVALAIIGLGVLIVVAPASVPALMSPM